MHILLAVVAVVAAAYWLWRRRNGLGALGAPSGQAGDDIRGALRRIGTPRSGGGDPAEQLDDARLAAAGMMAAIAGMDGPMSRAQIDAIRVECRAVFRAPQAQADDIAAYGRWLAEQYDEPEEALRRLGARVQALAPPEAQKDLIQMLERVAAVENGISSDQRHAIDRVRRRLATA